MNKFNAHEKSDKELTNMITDLSDKITQARIDLTTKKSSDVKSIARLKKDLARSLTVLKERELAAAAKPTTKETE